MSEYPQQAAFTLTHTSDKGVVLSQSVTSTVVDRFDCPDCGEELLYNVLAVLSEGLVEVICPECGWLSTVLSEGEFPEGTIRLWS